MLTPSMKVLIEKTGNRYLLVNLAAKRARVIAEDAERNGIVIDEKTVKMALDEIAEDKIRVSSNLSGVCD